MRTNSHYHQAQFGGDCNVCREGAREVKRRLRTASQEEVEDKMLELCGYLGSFSTACMETVLDQSKVRFVYFFKWRTMGLCLGDLQNVDGTV